MLDVAPSARLEKCSSLFPDFDFKNVQVGPCGGFSRTYTSLCLLHNIPIREEIIWCAFVLFCALLLAKEAWDFLIKNFSSSHARDIDNIIFANGVKEFNLAEIDDLEGTKDLIPIFGALEGNKVEPAVAVLFTTHLSSFFSPLQWFTRLLLRDVKLNPDVHAAFCQLVRPLSLPLPSKQRNPSKTSLSVLFPVPSIKDFGEG